MDESISTEEIIEENIKELAVQPKSEGNNEKEDKFSFTAFLLGGSYYIFKQRYRLGLAFLLVDIIIPINFYFLVGLIGGFFVGRVRTEQVPTVKNYIFFVGSIILFVVCKYIRLRVLGGF